MTSSLQKYSFNKCLCATAPAEGTQIFFGQQQMSDVMNSGEVSNWDVPPGLAQRQERAQNRAPRGVNTCSQRPRGEWRWIWRLCVQGSGGAWERGCTMEGHKTDRRGGGEVIIGREVKVLLFRCVRQPIILTNLSVVEGCFCFWVVGCGAVVALRTF